MHGFGRLIVGVRLSWLSAASAFIVIGPLAQAASASPNGPAESTVREIVARDLSTILTDTDKKNDDRRFMSPDLYRLYTKKRQSFDSDPYTGTQDSSDYTIAKVTSASKSATGVVVTVEFAVEGAPESHPRLAYDMVLSQGRWLVQDIAYGGDQESFHQILNDMH